MKIAFYKGTHDGWRGLYNVLVRWWTKSPYSHCEVVFSNGLSASSSWFDKGVRFKLIDYNPERWDFLEIDEDEGPVYDWFVKHLGEKYDILGNIHFVLGFIPDDTNKWSCSEALAAAFGIKEPYRVYPAILNLILRFKHGK